MKPAVVLWLLCGLGVLMTGQGLRAGQRMQEKTEDRAAEAEIRRLTREFVEGFNSGDVERIMRFYADTYVDVNLRQPVQSKQERAEYYRRIVARGDTKVDVVPDEILVAGDHAFARGTILLDRTPKEGGESKRTELRYMEVWRKFPDGWKSIWGMDAEIYPEGK